jgi:polysaccharide pyruvyl transferase WcaK-like protein
MTLTAPRVIRGNRGDLLSRLGLLQAMRETGLDDILVFCSQRRDIGELPFWTASYGRLYNLIPTRRGLTGLRRARAVLHTGGLDLQDDSSLLKLIHTLAVFKMYRSLGLPIYVLMQGAGPIGKTSGRVLTRKILDQVTVFVARDPATYELLRSINPKTRILLGYDGIFAGRNWPGQPSRAEAKYIRQIMGTGSPRPHIGFNLRQWFHFHSGILPYHMAQSSYQIRARSGMKQFVKASCRLINRLRSELKARIILISMYEPGTDPWEDDLTYLARIKDRFRNDPYVVLTDRDLGLMAFYRLMGGLDMMIGTRLHSTLTAIRLGVPAINISYTLKGRDIFNYLGLGNQVVDLEWFINAPEELVDMARKLLGNDEVRKRQLAASQWAIDTNHRIIEELMSDYLP